METKLIPYHDIKLETPEQIILPYTVLKKISHKNPPYYFQITTNNKIFYTTVLEFSGPLRKVGLHESIYNETQKGERIIIKHIQGIYPGKRVKLHVPKKFLEYEYYDQALEVVLSKMTFLEIDQVFNVPMVIYDTNIEVKVVELEANIDNPDQDYLPHIIAIKDIDLEVDFEIEDVIEENYNNVIEENYNNVNEENEEQTLDEGITNIKEPELTREEVRQKRLDFYKKMGMI